MELERLVEKLYCDGMIISDTDQIIDVICELANNNGLKLTEEILDLFTELEDNTEYLKIETVEDDVYEIIDLAGNVDSAIITLFEEEVEEEVEEDVCECCGECLEDTYIEDLIDDTISEILDLECQPCELCLETIIGEAVEESLKYGIELGLKSIRDSINVHLAE